MSKNKYCTECGLKLVETVIGAEKYKIFHPFVGEIEVHNKFDSETGKRQYVRRFKCPKRFWVFDNHDDYMEEKLVKLLED